jgi:hypothetical protein
MIGRAGADLILHGHNHVISTARIPGPDGRGVPVVGVSSASARPDGHGATAARRASYIVYEVARSRNGYALEARRRGLGAEGTMCDLGPVDVT